MEQEEGLVGSVYQAGSNQFFEPVSLGNREKEEERTYTYKNRI